jgi:hypothetical protein
VTETHRIGNLEFRPNEHFGEREAVGAGEPVRVRLVDVWRVSDGRPVGQFMDLAERDLAEASLSYLVRKAGGEEPDPVHCAACGARLEPEHRDTDYQFEGALWVVFEGGYGMFVDPCDEPAPRAVICHGCAHELCALVPWAGELLQPHTSHSHRTDYIEKNPHHWGWDYDRRKEEER